MPVMQRLRKSFFVLWMAAIACGGSKSGSSTSEPQIEAPPSQIPGDKFLSYENPGRWGEQKADHQILVKTARVYTMGKQKLRELSIVIPLEGNSSHYIEAALALDHSLKKEIDKIQFAPGKPAYDLKLTVPAENPHAIFIVIKCNLHDMWLKRVEPLPKAED